MIFLILAILGLPMVSPVHAQADKAKRDQQTEKVMDKIRKLGLGERSKLRLSITMQPNSTVMSKKLIRTTL